MKTDINTRYITTIEAVKKLYAIAPDEVYAYHEAISLCFDDEGQCTAVFVGTEDEERFSDLLELFGYEDWSYTSYDDED